MVCGHSCKAKERDFSITGMTHVLSLDCSRLCHDAPGRWHIVQAGVIIQGLSSAIIGDVADESALVGIGRKWSLDAGCFDQRVACWSLMELIRKTICRVSF